MDLRRQTNCLFRNLIFHVHSERRSYYTALLCLFFPAGQATPAPEPLFVARRRTIGVHIKLWMGYLY
jgi:hypothetical protein